MNVEGVFLLWELRLTAELWLRLRIYPAVWERFLGSPAGVAREDIVSRSWETVWFLRDSVQKARDVVRGRLQERGLSCAAKVGLSSFRGGAIDVTEFFLNYEDNSLSQRWLWWRRPVGFARGEIGRWILSLRPEWSTLFFPSIFNKNSTI